MVVLPPNENPVPAGFAAPNALVAGAPKELEVVVAPKAEVVVVPNAGLAAPNGDACVLVTPKPDDVVPPNGEELPKALAPVLAPKALVLAPVI